MSANNAKRENRETKAANIMVEVCGSDGSHYSSLRRLAKSLRVDRNRVADILNKKGKYVHNGVTYTKSTLEGQSLAQKAVELNAEYEENREEFEQWKQAKLVEELPFEKYDFKFSKKKEGSKYAVALFSDAHIEETVKPNAVLGLNEYNLDIAKQRIEKYFVNLVNCINHDKVDDLIFASLGDTCSCFIHSELEQESQLTPIEATLWGQTLIYSGLEYICTHTNLKSIKFIGIVGNHTRTTKKIQHANGYKMSYEWMMYQNIKKHCELKGLPIEFCIPESELALVDVEDGKRFIFCHGFQIKGGGTNTITGIFPALMRLSLRWHNIFKQDHIFLGHFHSCTSIKNATVNGSIIGYNSFAMSHGMPFESPAQVYVLYDTQMGEILSRKIYCTE